MTQSLQALRAEQYEAATYVRSILNATAGRDRSAYEQNQLDEGMRLVENTTAAYRAADLRISEAAALRMAQERQFGPMTSTPSSTRNSNDFGEQLHAAIGEVRDGRSVAYVDFPEHRAIAESGTGGYLVNNAMGSPVMALAAKSVVMSLPGVRHLTATSGDRLRLPRFNALNVTGIAEAATLPSAASDLDAIDIGYTKFATYELISNEAYSDASYDALSLLGERMLMDLAARVDLGLIQGNGANDIVGLFNQPGISTTSVAGVPTIAKAQEAEYQLLANDGNPTAWLMSSRSWVGASGFRRILVGLASSVQPVLQLDPSQGVSTMSGFPVYTTSAISNTTGATSVGSTVGLVDASQIIIVTRQAPRIEISRDVAFASDSVAIRAVTRVGLALTDSAGAVSTLTDCRTA